MSRSSRGTAPISDQCPSTLHQTLAAAEPITVNLGPEICEVHLNVCFSVKGVLSWSHGNGASRSSRPGETRKNADKTTRSDSFEDVIELILRDLASIIGSRASVPREGHHYHHQEHQQQQHSAKQSTNNYTPTKIANLLSRKFTKISKSPKLDKEKSNNKANDNEFEGSFQCQKSSEEVSVSISSHYTPAGTPRSSVTPHGTLTATSPHQGPIWPRGQKKINRDEDRRTENLLKIWILEVKGVPTKKKYYCNIVVDGQLRHSTVAKQKTNMCFWGEDFHISVGSQESIVSIELMRQADKKNTKLLGRITIPLQASCTDEAALAGLLEQWYPINSDKQEKNAPQLRIKHRFQSLTVLPLVKYGKLREYVAQKSTSLCQLLEPVLSVKAKEDLALALVHISHAEGCINNFLVTLILNDINRIESEQCLFRGNSVATKAIEAYMRLIGEQYLQETLSSVIQKIISATEDMEVDPLRITNTSNLPTIIKHHQAALRVCLEQVWEVILHSADHFPIELRKVFHMIRQRLTYQKEKLELTDNLISACVFLRFICPAILSPSLFNIIQEYPEERAARYLTLVAKTIQTLANFTCFHRKENYMEFLNDFIAQEQTNCRNFLRKVSSYDAKVGSHLEFVGNIDLGLHLALLHTHLAEALPNICIKENEVDTQNVVLLVREISSEIDPTSVILMENILNSTVDTSHRFIQSESASSSNPSIDYSEFYSSMDSWSLQMRNLCMDDDSPGNQNNNQGSQISISQLSNNASSGYQSISYSQSSSPAHSVLHMDKIDTQLNNIFLNTSDGCQSSIQLRDSSRRGRASSSPSSSHSTEDLFLVQPCSSTFSAGLTRYLRPASDSSDHENDSSPDSCKPPPQRLTKAATNGNCKISSNLHHQLKTTMELDKDIAKDNGGSKNILEAQEHQMKEILERLRYLMAEVVSKVMNKGIFVANEAQKFLTLDCISDE
ncbi:unnamed protein product, partial [Meganyctiphanes norvegica]